MQSTNEGMDVDKKSEAKFLSNCAARLMAAEVFKLPGSAAYQERERTNEIASKEGAKKNNFVRKIGAHIKNKAARERESAQRANLAKVGEPLESDVVRINNNISLEVSNHTSRHTMLHLKLMNLRTLKR